jgi:capsular exopolysaccharide synthesis family protein
MFTGDNEQRPKVLVLTSAGPAEGKSTIVSNLGIALADIGHRVLLIDADLRKPRLQSIFGLPNDSGLSDALRERSGTNKGARVNGFIHESEIPRVFVMTSGSYDPSATSLLFGSYLPELLDELRAEFDVILIDTPPMLNIPDARVIGRLADSVILVMRSGKTTRDAALAATQRFTEDGIPVLGTVLNDWNPKASPDGYYGYSNYSYGYRSYHSNGKESLRDGSLIP